jgi:Tannase and feruloyl esterase/PKD domain
MNDGAIDVSGYTPTDAFFGPPYVDEDAEWESPAPHRMIHGGFEGTDTRFRFHFPPADAGYQGRMINPLSGANGGTEDFFHTILGEGIGGLSMCLRLGGYVVQSNQGHVGDALDPKAGEDPTIYGHRASAEVARLSKYVAAQIYGAPPHHSYVFGGSGGGRRSPLCLENAPDVWDGALPFMGGGDFAEPGNTKRLKGANAISFCTMFNVQRVLGDKLLDVIDATAPGGSGNPFAGLDTHQREELAALYRLGFPRGDELMIGEPAGQMWLWASQADSIYEQEPDYFENFWTKPGYVGHDQPRLLEADRLDRTVAIDRVMTVQDVVDDPTFLEPQYHVFRGFCQAMAEGTGTGYDLPAVLELKDLGPGYRLGTGVRVVDGKGAGRQLYCIAFAGDYFLCDARGETSNIRFTDVRPGDEVHVDNSRWLAYGYYARHHVMDDIQFDSLRVDGIPVFPQHPLADMSSMMGVCYSGQYRGKLMWVHHTHDASLWPPCGVGYADGVLAAQGEDGVQERFRIRWTQNAEHGPLPMLPTVLDRAPNTWLIDYVPVIEQSLADLFAWVERGVEPASTTYEYVDGKVTLPETAAQRGGIQPVVHVSANGALRAEVEVGEPVTLEVHAEVPPGTGTLVDVAWDFDGSGTFPFSHPEVDGTATDATLSVTHTYERPGTYFATALVHSHRDGDVAATSRRLPNVAQARVVVT